VRNGQVRNLHITGCDLEANMPVDDTPTKTANVLIDQSAAGVNSSIAEVAITGCTIQHSAHYGASKRAPGGANIRILGHDGHQPNMITMTGNVLSDTTTHIHLNQVMDVTLTGNTFFTTEPTDLLIEKSKRVNVSGNVFHPREAGAVGGIVLRESSHCLLLGLTIHKFAGKEASILLERCSASRVAQCLISESRQGIKLVDCAHCVVSDCTITGLPDGVEAVTASGEKNVVRNILQP
jgi:parallel beta-helix repeat protein